MTLIEIEKIENKYLNKYYHLLKALEDEIIDGLKTKEDIRECWEPYWNSKSSDFSTGAERIIYSLLHGNIVGKINSSPVGSDLMFELPDAFVHIDVKTYGGSNINDFKIKHDIGINQTSYSSEICEREESGSRKRFTPEIHYHKPNLPKWYKKNDGSKKICLTYFISILAENHGKDIICILFTCVPNGILRRHYKHRPIVPGKTVSSTTNIFPDGRIYKLGKARFCFADVNQFELISENPSRVKVISWNETRAMRYDLTLIKSFT